uniref:Uncharacterized protein n=1 Tax=viral metagenome TaxID=1070528 RepID=A0A6H1ZQV7_9ZZZZ
MTEQIYFPKESSISQYLNYIYLRMKEGFEITEEEERYTYKFYKEYCMQNDISIYSLEIFYRELKRLGFESKQKYSRVNNCKRVRKREFPIEILKKVLGDIGGKSNAIHAGIVTLGGIDYQIIVKLLKITPEHSGETAPPKVEVDGAENN